MNNGEVGAVVIGGEHPGLGIARSLGRRGIPVCVIDDQFSVSQFSKYVTRVVRVKDLTDEARTVESVLDVGERYGMRGWVLFATRDETVAAFARHREKLQDVFRVATTTWEAVQWAWDKTKSYKLAEQLGIPSPRTYQLRSEEELNELQTSLPLAIKPAIKEHFFYATGAKAWRAESADQLKRLYRKAAQLIGPEEIMLQEIIPGNGDRQYSYCAFFRNGRSEAKLIARRMRQHPREFGRAATYVETAELPEIEELSERFLRAIDYNGLVEIEFKHDPRDGKFKLLDVNARIWGFHALGRAAGVDFPYMQYAEQVGEPVHQANAISGVGWLRLITDLPTALSDLFKGHLSWASYCESLRNTRVESVFSADDFLPSLAEFAMLPYFVAKKYLVKSVPTRRRLAAISPVVAKGVANESDRSLWTR